MFAALYWGKRKLNWNKKSLVKTQRKIDWQFKLGHQTSEDENRPDRIGAQAKNCDSLEAIQYNGGHNQNYF